MSAHAPEPVFSPSRPAAPRKGWYAVSAALLALALALIATIVVVQWDGLRAAGASDAAGSNSPGVRIELVRGARYEVYVEADPTSSAGPRDVRCVLTPVGGEPSTVAVTGGQPGEQVARDGFGYWSVGEFEAPLAGPAAVSCAGGAGRLVVRPDDRPYLVLGGALVVAVLLGLPALVVFLVVLVLRRRRPAGNPPV